MPKPPRPRKKGQFYVVSAGKIQFKLCIIEEGLKEAKHQMDRLMEADPGVWPPKLANDDLMWNVFNHFCFVKSVETSASTFDYYCRMLAPLFSQLSCRPITSIKLQDGLKYKEWLMHEEIWKKGNTHMVGLSTRTINHHLRCAKMFFKWAASPCQGYLQVDPWKEISYLPEARHKRG